MRSESGWALESFDPLLGFGDAKFASAPVPKQRFVRVCAESPKKWTSRKNRIEGRPHPQRGRPALRLGCSLVI